MSRPRLDHVETSPEALAIASCEGDEHSFERLVRDFSPRLLALAFRYTKDWESARDLCQETWIKVHGELPRYDTRRPFAPWLHAIHRNHCLSYLRKSLVRHERKTLPLSAVSNAGAKTDAAPTGQAQLKLVGEDDPLERILRREFAARLGAALARLSRQQRRVFALVEIEETPQIEAARLLGLAPGTLRATLHVARRRLAELLARSPEAP